MAQDLTLRVITPDRIVLDTTASTVQLPGLDGLIGVLPRHAPMLAQVACGIVHVVAPDRAHRSFAAGAGFAEVRADRVDLVVDFLNAPDDVDVDRAHGALRRASGRLRSKDPAMDLARAEAALCRAVARLKVCGCGCSFCGR